MFGNNNTIAQFRMLGFDIKLDASWIFIASLITWSLSTRYFPYSIFGLNIINYWILGAVGAAGFFLSILLHELGHSVTARRYGIPIRGITLMIFGGVAELESNPKNPKEEFMVAAAGPLVSFLLSALFFALSGMVQNTDLSRQVLVVFRYLFMINMVLGIFNLVPAFPLDGGRILRAILWKASGNYGQATRWSATAGIYFSYAMMALGAWELVQGNYISGLWWFFIASFLNGNARAVAQYYRK